MIFGSLGILFCILICLGLVEIPIFQQIKFGVGSMATFVYFNVCHV